MEVLFQCWCILDGEGELGQLQGAIDPEFEDLVELLSLLGGDGFVVGIGIIDVLLWLMN